MSPPKGSPLCPFALSVSKRNKRKQVRSFLCLKNVITKMSPRKCLHLKVRPFAPSPFPSCLPYIKKVSPKVRPFAPSPYQYKKEIKEKKFAPFMSSICLYENVSMKMSPPKSSPFCPFALSFLSMRGSFLYCWDIFLLLCVVFVFQMIFLSSF